MGSRVHQEKTYRTSLDGVLLVLAAGGFPTGVLIFGLHRQYWWGRGQAGKDIAVLVANLNTKLSIWDGLWELVHLISCACFHLFRCTMAMVAAALPLVATSNFDRVYTGLHRELVGCVGKASGLFGCGKLARCVDVSTVSVLLVKSFVPSTDWHVCMRIGSVVLLTGIKRAT